MSSDRVNPFGSLDDFAPAPRKEKAPKPVEKAAIEQVAAENGFPSRQPVKPAAKPAARQQRRYTTGRNQQLNIKATAETIARMNALADKLQAPLGEVLELALVALEKATK